MTFSDKERFYQWTSYAGAVAVAVGLVLATVLLDDVDSHWRPRIGMKTWNRKHPIIAIDEAHRNTHTASGRSQPLATLLQDDGYRVERSAEPLRADALKRVQVLVTINPSGLFNDAFRPEELEVVEHYVRGGGRLLLIADRDAAGGLAARFGVVLTHPGKEPNVFRNLGDHPAMRGVRCFASAGGQTVQMPPGATALLRSQDEVQAVALEFGKGRVAILTDAGIATAIIGKNKARIGLNNTDCDHLRFARSLMDWLSDGSL